MRSLVIDDEFVALSKMVAMLEPLGQCDAATSSMQALEMFRAALNDACPYRLVTIDINLPDMNGITLLGRLQREERKRDAPRSRKVMVTAESTASNVLAALSGESDGFLVKPVRRAMLLEKLASLGLLTESVARHAGEEPLCQHSQRNAAATGDESSHLLPSEDAESRPDATPNLAT